jgi:hypothetical protein
MPRTWTRDHVLKLAASYKHACVLAAAAELDLFETIGSRTVEAGTLAGELAASPRGVTMLLDGLTALELVDKTAEGTYQLPPTTREVLTSAGQHNVRAMVHHQMKMMRRWVQLGSVVKTGEPIPFSASLRGEEADRDAFVEAMNDINAQVAPKLVKAWGPFTFSHLLDIGGATGTWTIAFLRAVAGAKATLFDLPNVVPLAERRLQAEGLADRVNVVGGDFYTDALPGGADFALLSAITHQNGREQNRDLYRKVHAALVDGGELAIRDVVMDETRRQPVEGAMFAINMLAGTQEGGTFTREEYAEDLAAAGFRLVDVIPGPQYMDTLLRAKKQ